jgi:hypothetical protein
MSTMALDSTDAHIATNIRILMARDALASLEDLAPRVGIRPSTLYRRMTTGGWRATEVERVALYFGMKPGDLYSDPAGIRLTQAKGARFPGLLSALPMRSAA